MRFESVDRGRLLGRAGFAGSVALLGVCVLSACGAPAGEDAADLVRPAAETQDVDPAIDPPAAPGAFAPNLVDAGGEILATWIEPEWREGEERPAVHRVRFARFEGSLWSEPSTVAEGDDHFANWADFPEAAVDAAGRVYVHWLAKTGEDTYAYSPFLARSEGGGQSWTPVGKINRDDTDTEHGFVSFVSEADGVRAFWLDGREMVEGGPMTVRTARVDETGSEESVVDARVCECCSTDAVMTADGPLVVYRDRSEEEVRDVYAVRLESGGATAPAPVHADGWTIEGCPVNGPAVAASGRDVAVAWFTAANDEPRVKLAFSGDAGSTFGPPVSVNDEPTLGRVDVLVDQDAAGEVTGAWVSWMASAEDRAAIRVRRVGRDGSLGPVSTVAETSAARASGFPVMVARGDERFLAWVALDGERRQARIRMRRL